LSFRIHNDTLIVELNYLLLKCPVPLDQNIPWKDYKAVSADLKLIYQASTELKAQDELDRFAATWD